MKFPVIILLLLTVTGCAGVKQESKSSSVSEAPCETAFTVLPDNFIIDLAAGSSVELNPAYHVFALFCTPEEAEEALENDLAIGRIPSSTKWQVYSLDGTFSDLAEPCGKDQYCLSIPAKLKDWVSSDK